MAKCKISTAPINLLASNTTACETKCNLFYNYANSSCQIVTKNNYLDIQCFDGNNYVEFGVTGRCRVTNVRLYKPSLNRYEGKTASAELIITHSSSGRNVYICIPVEINDDDGDSAKWFSKFIPHCTSEKNFKKSINVDNFSLNSVIPQSGFYIYEGGTFNWGCKKKDIMILFHKNKAITMKSKNYKHLAKLINSPSYNVRANPPYITYNSIGTSSGPGRNPGTSKKDTLTCVPIIDQDGNNIADDGDLPWKGLSSPTTSLDSTKVSKENILQNIVIILAIIGGVLLIWILGWAWGKVMHNPGATGNQVPAAHV